MLVILRNRLFGLGTLLCRLLLSVLLYLVEPKSTNSQHQQNNKQLQPISQCFRWWHYCILCRGVNCYLAIAAIETCPIPAERMDGKNEYGECN